MDDWIPFEEGEYLTEKAFLFSSDHRAVTLQDAVVEVFKDPSGAPRLRGRGRIQNILMVELLEEDERLDIVLDFGAEFKFRLKQPKIQGGKVFAADVRSSMLFLPTAPWERLSESAFADLVASLRFLSN
jgi:hypothetical protein